MISLSFFIVLVRLSAVKYLIDNTVFQRLSRAHEMISFGVLGDGLYSLTRMGSKNFIELLPNIENLTGMNVDIGGLALESA